MARKAENSAPRTRKKAETGSQRVYSTLRRRILGLELRPGAEIDETAIAAELGVSRTPIREALIRLAAEELVMLTPNRGARVPVLDITDVGELFDALEITQRIVSRWASLKRSREDIVTLRALATAYATASQQHDREGMREANYLYHKAIGDACGNRYYQRLNATLLSRSQRLAQLTIDEAPRSEEAYRAYFEEVNAEHHRMVDFIEAQNADAVEEMMREHIRQFRIRSLDVVKRSLDDRIVLR